MDLAGCVKDRIPCMTGETWLPVVGYESLYEVSDEGKVRSLRSGRLMSLCDDGRGYVHVGLAGPNGKVGRRVHVLVAAAFIGPRPDGMDVRHMDGTRDNNRVDNLAYGTRADNMQDAIRHGTLSPSNRNKPCCRRGHEFTEENTYRTRKGSRDCRACQRLHKARYRRMKRSA